MVIEKYEKHGYAIDARLMSFTLGLLMAKKIGSGGKSQGESGGINPAAIMLGFIALLVIGAVIARDFLNLSFNN